VPRYRLGDQTLVCPALEKHAIDSMCREHTEVPCNSGGMVGRKQLATGADTKTTREDRRHRIQLRVVIIACVWPEIKNRMSSVCGVSREPNMWSTRISALRTIQHFRGTGYVPMIPARYIRPRAWRRNMPKWGCSDPASRGDVTLRRT
jgi:hypothetical protein